MTPPQAKRTVLVGLVLGGGVAAGTYLVKDAVPPKRLVFGVVGAGVLLGSLAEFAPGIAASIAVALAITTVFVTGGPFWEAALKILNTPTKGNP